MGAIVADAKEEDAQLLYEYGLNLGIAFQLQDDYLDTFGDPKTFGKQVGGDIIENKKTFLYLKAVEEANEEDRKRLINYFSQSNTLNNKAKVAAVKTIFETSGAAELTKQAIEKYTIMAFEVLDGLNVETDKKQILKDFGESLMFRKV